MAHDTRDTHGTHGTFSTRDSRGTRVKHGTHDTHAFPLFHVSELEPFLSSQNHLKPPAILIPKLYECVCSVNVAARVVNVSELIDSNSIKETLCGH